MLLVLDIGGTFIKYAFSQKDGTFIQQGKIPTPTSSLDDFLNAIKPLVSSKIEGIAISSPGVIDSSTGYIEVVDLLPFFSGQNMKTILEAQFQVPVWVENDAKCAALAELFSGSLKDVESGLMLVLGSGVGGAIIINGKLYKGPRAKAGEIGAFLSSPTMERQMSFGRQYSAVWLVRDIAKALNIEDDGMLVFEAIKAGHPIALDYFNAYCEGIARTLYNIDYVLDLDVIAIGGGISAQPILIETIQEKFMTLRRMYDQDHDPSIVACTYLNDANLIGAYANFATMQKC